MIEVCSTISSGIELLKRKILGTTTLESKFTDHEQSKVKTVNRRSKENLKTLYWYLLFVLNQCLTFFPDAMKLCSNCWKRVEIQTKWIYILATLLVVASIEIVIFVTCARLRLWLGADDHLQDFRNGLHHD